MAPAKGTANKSKYIVSVLSSEGVAKLPFVREPDGLIFRFDNVAIGDYAFTPRRLCVPNSCIKDVLEIAYGEGYPGNARLLEKASAWYIRYLVKHVRDYVSHCLSC